jgi:Protein of unknown function (DUF3309)
MSLLLIILIVLLLVGVPGGWRYGGPYAGGGVGLVILILIILALMAEFEGRPNGALALAVASCRLGGKSPLPDV